MTLNPTLEPYDPSCKKFAKDITSYDASIAGEYELDSLEDVTPEMRERFVRNEEGTYNPVNGHFLCDSCYIKVGCPSSPTGWKCP